MLSITKYVLNHMWTLLEFAYWSQHMYTVILSKMGVKIQLNLFVVSVDFSLASVAVSCSEAQQMASCMHNG